MNVIFATATKNNESWKGKAYKNKKREKRKKSGKKRIKTRQRATILLHPCDQVEKKRRRRHKKKSRKKDEQDLKFLHWHFFRHHT